MQVNVEVNSAGTLTFYEGTTRRYSTSTSSGWTYTYNAQQTSWRVTHPDLAYADDYCVGGSF